MDRIEAEGLIEPVVVEISKAIETVRDGLRSIGKAESDSYEDERNIADGLFSIAAHLTSANESDRNLEAANVVDGMYEISRAIRDLASAVRGNITVTHG